MILKKRSNQSPDTSASKSTASRLTSLTLSMFTSRIALIAESTVMEHSTDVWQTLIERLLKGSMVTDVSSATSVEAISAQKESVRETQSIRVDVNRMKTATQIPTVVKIHACLRLKSEVSAWTTLRASTLRVVSLESAQDMVHSKTETNRIMN